MKKATKVIALVMVCMLALVALVACGVSENDAKAINEAAKNKENWTYEKCKQKFGTPTYDVSGSGSYLDVTGWIVWVNGCKTPEEVNEKIKNGESVSALSVQFLNGKAVSAQWKPEYNPDK